jgi:hypothetical protein
MKIRLKKGMTLTELIITSATIVVLAGVVLTVYIAVLRSWLGQERRMRMSTVLDRTIKEVTNDLREARGIDFSINDDEIRFTPDQSTYYIYYFYNSGDSYPPAFSQASYDLKKATLAGGISGTFTYGDGRIILTNVLPPTTSDLSYDGSLVTLDLSVAREDETIRAKTKVNPRNL